jgi:hypothetical protein
LRRAAIIFATRRKIFRFSVRASVSEKISIQVITLIALSRLTAMETKQPKRKEKQ